LPYIEGMETKGTAKRAKAPKLPTYLVGAHAETIAEYLGISLELARAAKAASEARFGRVLHDAACVRGEASSESLK